MQSKTELRHIRDDNRYVKGGCRAFTQTATACLLIIAAARTVKAYEYELVPARGELAASLLNQVQCNCFGGDTSHVWDRYLYFSLNRVESWFGPQDTLSWEIDGVSASEIDTGGVRLVGGQEDSAIGMNALILNEGAPGVLGPGPHRVRLSAHLVDTVIDAHWDVTFFAAEYGQALARLEIDTTGYSSSWSFGKATLSIVETGSFDTTLFHAHSLPPISSLRSQRLEASFISLPDPDSLSAGGRTHQRFVAQACVNDTTCCWEVSYFPLEHFLDSAGSPFPFDSAMAWFRETDVLPDPRLGLVFQEEYESPQEWLRAYHDSTYWYLEHFYGEQMCPMGCSIRRRTRYRVSPDGEVIVDSCYTTYATHYPCPEIGTVLREGSAGVIRGPGRPAAERHAGVNRLFDLRGRDVSALCLPERSAPRAAGVVIVDDGRRRVVRVRTANR